MEVVAPETAAGGRTRGDELKNYVNCCQSTVSRLLTKPAIEGHVQDRPRFGCPYVTNEGEDAFVVTQARYNPFTTVNKILEQLIVPNHHNIYVK